MIRRITILLLCALGLAGCGKDKPKPGTLSIGENPIVIASGGSGKILTDNRVCPDGGYPVILPGHSMYCKKPAAPVAKKKEPALVRVENFSYPPPMGVCCIANESGLTAGTTVDGKCYPTGAICTKSDPTPEWVPDPSAGHYDCPDGWTAGRIVYSEPGKWIDPTGPGIDYLMPNLYFPKLDKKGHALAERPTAPKCFKNP